MVPGQVTLIPNFLIVKYLGWIDTYQALIIPQSFSAFGTFLLRQFFLGIPRELEDAARIDGASSFGIYRRIILPLSGPALAQQVQDIRPEIAVLYMSGEASGVLGVEPASAQVTPTAFIQKPFTPASAR
jgi:ABC-type arginine/histidine transport system permease subunit